MNGILFIEGLLQRYEDLRNCFKIFDGQLIFTGNGLNDWTREVNFFLQDSDVLIAEYSKQDKEFQAFLYSLVDAKIERCNQRRVESCSPICRTSKTFNNHMSQWLLHMKEIPPF